MEKVAVANGIFWVEIPEADLRILCGCPADSVKHLMNKGLIVSEEKNGVMCETGPNAILLSEAFVQSGQFSNLSEFPILQILYRQGLILPNHPNNNGRKPMLIGSQKAIKTQSDYIYRGNYGLISIDEILESGASQELAEEVMRFKLKFAFDNIRSTEELIDTKKVECEKPVEIANNVFIKRTSFNIYEINYKNESVTIDLNLPQGIQYIPPYRMNHYQINKEYFSIIHSGEGDGWDKERPCMASIITFQGKVYLIDAGPNLLHSLQFLGIGIAEIEGIFHTHSHDDHFSGLTALMGSDHKIKYFATPLVRQATIKKFSSLTGMDSDHFLNYFKIHDLELDTWNSIDGLDVKPILSPHPVETSVLFFRTLWGGGYKTYSHLADVSSFSVLESMIEDDPKKSGISQDFFNQVTKNYLEPTDIKKIDIGGGMIHGEAVDFKNDQSKKILLSHTATNLSDKEREIGSNAHFGVSDTLIKSTQDYTKQKAFYHFQEYFPSVPKHELIMLLNGTTANHNPGSIIIKKGQISKDVHFILSGIMEFVSSEFNIQNKLSVGSFAGELSGIQSRGSRGTYRAISHVNTLQIPRNLYIEFLKRNNIFDKAIANIEKRQFLQITCLIGEQVSCPLKSRIARHMKSITVPVGWEAPLKHDSLYMFDKGEINLTSSGHIIRSLRHGDFFGEEHIVNDPSNRLDTEVKQESSLWEIPSEAFVDIPIIYWKLIEAHETRMKKVNEMGR